MPKFDLAQTQALMDLFETPRENRDDAWQRRFYATVPDATLMSFAPQVNQGPDQFPYFHLAIPDPGPVTPFCVTHILDDVLDNGFGVAIFGDSSRSKPPEWVFTYGDLLSYSLFGTFDGDPAAIRSSGGTGSSMLVATPSEAYLPTRARKAIGDFMRAKCKHPDPKVALVDNPQLNPSRNLMVNLSLEQYDGDKRTLDAAMHYLTWYIPRSYALMPMPPGWNDSAFVPLH